VLELRDQLVEALRAGERGASVRRDRRHRVVGVGEVRRERVRVLARRAMGEREQRGDAPFGRLPLAVGAGLEKPPQRRPRVGRAQPPEAADRLAADVLVVRIHRELAQALEQSRADGSAQHVRVGAHGQAPADHARDVGLRGRGEKVRGSADGIRHAPAPHAIVGLRDQGSRAQVAQLVRPRPEPLEHFRVR
jgi:hypothetical protein